MSEIKHTDPVCNDSHLHGSRRCTVRGCRCTLTHIDVAVIPNMTEGQVDSFMQALSESLYEGVDPKIAQSAQYWHAAVSPLRDIAEEMTEVTDMVEGLMPGGPFSAKLREWAFRITQIVG